MGQRDEYVKTIKSTAATLGTNSLYAMLVAELPIFANPILGYIAKEIIAKALAVLLDTAEFGAFYLFIDFRSSEEGRQAYEDMKALVKAHTSGTPQEKENAEKRVKVSFRRLVTLSA